MLRRLSTAPHVVRCAASSSSISFSSFLLFSTTSPLLQTTTTAAAAAPNSVGSRSSSRPSLSEMRARRSQLPPAFDIVHWNDDDITRGHLLRVLHRDSFVVLDYHKQAKKTTEEGNKAERAVSVMLPAVYIARFLSVLEGRGDKVEVHSRYTNATFAPIANTPHTYKLNCTSTKPPQQQQQQQQDGGKENAEEVLQWAVEFDAAESLMLHRFLTQALHYNTGFARTAP